MSSSHVASNSVRESDGLYVFDMGNVGQALLKPGVSLRCRFVAVVFARLALSVAVDNAVLSAETFLGSERVDVAGDAVVASLFVRVSVGVGKLGEDEFCESLRTRRSAVALMSYVLSSAVEDIDVDEFQASVADVGPVLYCRTPFPGRDLAEAERIRALSQPVGR